MWGQLSTSCSNVVKQKNGELLVAVNHNQHRTGQKKMASETVDPIDWSHPPPSWAVPPVRHVHSINQCNLSGTRTCNRSMRGNHLAYAATQGLTLRYNTTVVALYRTLRYDTTVGALISRCPMTQQYWRYGASFAYMTQL